MARQLAGKHCSGFRPRPYSSMRRLPGKRDFRPFLLVLLLLSGVSGWADPIAVPNFSFESPDITTDGAFTATSISGDTTAVPNWTATFTAGNSSLRAGVQEAAGTEYPGATGNNAPLPLPAQGGQYAYLNLDSSTGSSSSITTTTPVAVVSGGTTYSLTVAIGRRLDAIPYDVTIALLVDGNVAVSASTTGQSLTSGAFVDLTTSLTVTPNSLYVGGQLAIRLIHSTPGNGSSGFYQANFDNVRLSVTSASTPTPTPSTNLAVPRFQAAGNVALVKTLPDGKILIRGGFSYVNGFWRFGLARLNSDGTVDETFDASPTLNRLQALPSFFAHLPPPSLATQSDGKLVLGTNRGFVDFITANNGGPIAGFSLLRLTATGEIDTTFNPDPSIFQAEVAGVLPGSKIIVYNAYSLQNFLGIERLNSNGSVDQTFHSIVEAGEVVIQPDGKLLRYDGSALRRFNADGMVDTSFTTDPTLLRVYSFLLQADGKILVIGASNSQEYLFERLMADGSRDFAFQPSVDSSAFPHLAALQEDGKILVNMVEGRIIRLNSDGTTDTSFNQQITVVGPNVTGSDLHIISEPGGATLLAGFFQQVNGVRFNALARLHDGYLDTSFRPLVYSPGTVTTLAATSDNKVIAGGIFGRVDNSEADGIVRLNSDTSIDLSFRRDLWLNPFLSTLTVQTDGKVLATGSFSADGFQYDSLVRLNSDGTLDSSFALDPAVSAQVDSVAVQHDHRIICSGFFVPLDGSPPFTLARLNPGGTLDSTFTKSDNTFGPVALQPDGKSVVSQNGEISRFAIDGTLDEPFQGPTIDTGNGGVKDIKVAPDGAIFLGGGWATLNDVNQPNLARLIPDGALDTTFLPAVNDTVATMTLQQDGKLVIGGYFTAVNQVPQPGVARLNTDGTLDFGFAVDTQGGAVLASTQLPNGQIVVGGGFGIATSIITPNPDQMVPAGSAIPFANLVVTPSIKNVKEVRYLVQGPGDQSFRLIDVQTIPLATNGYLGPGQAENSGTPEYDSAVYSTLFIPQAGPYLLKVQVVDRAGNVISSTETSITAVDPGQWPPPQTFDLGGLANGTVLFANNSVIITATPKTQGSGLKKLELWVNKEKAITIDVGGADSKKASPLINYDSATGSYFFTFTPKAPGTFSLIIKSTASNGVQTDSTPIAVVAGPSSRLLNISTRMFVDTGDDVLIGGMIVTGSGQKKVLIRAVGPSLANAGVNGALQNPTLELYGPTGLIASNDDWGDSLDKQAIIDTTISPNDAKESAILATLPASATGIAYTAIVKGANGSTGVGLVEVYDLDGNVSSTRLANISTRGKVLPGDNAMIGGFILGGKAGAAPDKVIVRGIGPSLPFSGALQDPILELHQGPMTIASNDDWKESEAEVKATTIPPVNDHESAIVRTLQPLTATATIATTAIVRGKNDGTGIALVEVYDLTK